MKIETPFEWLAKNAISIPNEKAILGVNSTLDWFGLYKFVLQLSTKLHHHGLQPGNIILAVVPENLIIPLSLSAFRIGLAIAFVSQSVANEFVDENSLIINTKFEKSISASRQLTIDNDWLNAVYEIEDYVDSRQYLSLESPALITFTSGTTGQAKGAIFTIRNLMVRCSYRAHEDSEIGIMFSLYGMRAMVGINRAFQNILLGKPTFVYEGVKNVQEQLGLIMKYKPDSLRGSPVQIAALLGEVEIQSADIGFIERIYCAGSRFEPKLHAYIRKFMNPHIVVALGGTEYGGMASKEIGDAGFEDPSYMGKIRPTSKVRILDEYGNEVPDGEVGRIATKTEVLISEYYKNPGETERAFIDGWFLPGDTGYLDGKGGLYLEGRISELVNIGGVKLNPIDIDNIVLSEPGVEDCCCFALSNKVGVQELGIAIVPSDPNLQPSKLEQSLRSHPKLRSVQFRLLKMDSIPRNDMGKPMRAALSARFK